MTHYHSMEEDEKALFSLAAEMGLMDLGDMFHHQGAQETFRPHRPNPDSIIKSQDQLLVLYT